MVFVHYYRTGGAVLKNLFWSLAILKNLFWSLGVVVTGGASAAMTL
jgi:hypothetical protein